MLCTLFACIIFDGQAKADEIPAPPVGFTWFVSANKVGTFLKPDGWFVKEEGAKSDKALFITKENIGENKRFSTGLSVNMIPSVKA
jgi:hypothetical protein